MADTQLNIVIRADNRQAKQSIKEVAKTADTISDSFSRVGTAIAGAFSGLVIAGVLKQFGELADSLKLLNARLRLVTNSTQDFAEAQNRLRGIAKQSKTEYAAVATLFTRVAMSAKEAIPKEDLFTITEVTSNALRVSGADAAEASSLIRQFSQALASGVLRGDEFNSMAENGARLMQALADGLGMNIGQLRTLSQQGLLTREVVIESLKSQRKKLAEEAAKMPETMSTAMVGLKDAFIKGIHDLDKEVGGTQLVIDTLKTVTEHLGSVLKVGFAVAAAAAGAAMAKLTQAIIAGVIRTKEYIQSKLAEIAAEREARLAKLASLQASVKYAEMKLAEARATVAAATGVRRLALTERALLPAQQKLATAQAALNAAMSAGIRKVGILRGALSLLGGPLGLILTALTLGATAWVSWGDSAETALDKAKNRAKEVDDILESIERRKKYGAGSAGTLREELNVLFQKRSVLTETIAVTYRGKPPVEVQRELQKVDARIDKVRKGLQELDKESQDLNTHAPGQLTDLGRSLLRKSWDAYVNRFKKGKEKLQLEIKKLQAMAKQAGISLSSPEYLKAEALVRKRFRSTESVKALQDTIANAKAHLKAELDVLKSGLEVQKTALERALQERLISIKDYYSQKEAIETQELNKAAQAIQQQILLQKKLVASGDESVAANAKRQLISLEAQLIDINNKRADIVVKNAYEQAQAEKALKKALLDVRLELEQAQGRVSPETRKAAIRAQYEDLLKQVRANPDIVPGGEQTVLKLIDVKTARAELDDLEAQWRRTLEKMQADQEAVDIRRKAGLISNYEARKQIAEIQKEAAADMEELLPLMEKAAQAIGPEAVANVQRWKNELAKTKLVVNDVAATLSSQVQSAFAAMFESIGSGAKSAKAAMLDFARSVLAALNRIASQKIAEWIFGGFSSGFGNFFAKIFSFAEGGYVSGPGTSTSDSIPARLSNGEFVLRAAAVKNIGLDTLEYMNRALRPPTWFGSRLHLASGGLATAPATQQPQNLNVVLYDKRDSMEQFMASPAAEKSVMVMIQRNAEQVKRLLA